MNISIATKERACVNVDSYDQIPNFVPRKACKLNWKELPSDAEGRGILKLVIFSRVELSDNSLNVAYSAHCVNKAHIFNAVQ